jgi:hypothetical protein
MYAATTKDKRNDADGRFSAALEISRGGLGLPSVFHLLPSKAPMIQTRLKECPKDRKALFRFLPPLKKEHNRGSLFALFGILDFGPLNLFRI